VRTAFQSRAHRVLNRVRTACSIACAPREDRVRTGRQDVLRDGPEPRQADFAVRVQDCRLSRALNSSKSIHSDSDSDANYIAETANGETLQRFPAAAALGAGPRHWPARTLPPGSFRGKSYRPPRRLGAQNRPPPSPPRRGGAWTPRCRAGRDGTRRRAALPAAPHAGRRGQASPCAGALRWPSSRMQARARPSPPPRSAPIRPAESRSAAARPAAGLDLRLELTGPFRSHAPSVLNSRLAAS
jgi:hypothetical protein